MAIKQGTVRKSSKKKNERFRKSHSTNDKLTEQVSKLHNNYITKLFCVRSVSPLITSDELAVQIEQVRENCFSKIAHVKGEKLRLDEALRKFNKILRTVTRTQLQAQKPRVIVSCSIELLVYYQNNLYYHQGPCNWKQRRQYRLAKTCFYNLLKLYLPEKSEQVIRAIVEIVHKEKLWQLEDLCYQLVWAPVEFGASGAMLAHAIWDEVEAPGTNVQDAKAIIRILYELLDVYDWPEEKDTVVAVERLLKLYYSSVTVSSTGGTSPLNAPLRKGLEVCIRNTLKHLSNDHLLVAVRHMCLWSVSENTNDNTILDFGSTLEYAAFMHRANLYENTLTPEIFPLLMQMIASPSRLVSLLGNRVMQYLIDRRNNRSEFDTPKIFFESTQFDLKINRYYKRDKLFLKNYREILHDSLVRSMINHCSTRLNLEMTYCTICLIAVEVPCGFTAAALVCLAMNLQDLTLEQTEIQQEGAYHIHATVMAIMSLLCWIHRAKVFYLYVNKIMMERAQWAPHLNPPLQSRYSFAIHHVLWNKPELFFVDWEARYGLWKCFRLRDESRNANEIYDG